MAPSEHISERRLDDFRPPLTAIRILCGFQVAAGCCSMVVQGIFTGIILLHIQPELRHFLVSLGIWGGIIFLVTGVIGLRLRRDHFIPSLDLNGAKRGRALSSAFLTMNIVSAISAAALFAINGINLFWLSHRPIYLSYFYVIRHGDIYLFQPLTGTLLAVGVLELVVSAVCACLCCSLHFSTIKSAGSYSGFYAGRRLRTLVDYPHVVVDSPTSTLGRGRGRSYSQTSLMPSPLGAAYSAPPISAHQATIPPPDFAAGPPPSYEEAWEGTDICSLTVNDPIVLRESRRTPRSTSNARLFQSLQSARSSRTGF